MSVSDFTIPLNVVKRIINETLPQDCLANIQIEADFVKALARVAHIFVLIATSKASDNASENNRRTVHYEDVLAAISQLGYERFIPDLVEWHVDYMGEKEAALKSKKRKAEEERKTSPTKRIEADESSD